METMCGMNLLKGKGFCLTGNNRYHCNSYTAVAWVKGQDQKEHVTKKIFKKKTHLFG